MFDRRLESDVVSYNASISASAKGSQWARALVLLCEMLDRILESDTVSHSASISACDWGMLDDSVVRYAKQKCLHGFQRCLT